MLDYSATDKRPPLADGLMFELVSDYGLDKNPDSEDPPRPRSAVRIVCSSRGNAFPHGLLEFCTHGRRRSREALVEFFYMHQSQH